MLLKTSFNSVLPRLLFFFCRYKTSSFCIPLSHRALQLVFVEKVHLPLLGNDGGVVIVSLLIPILSVGLLWQAGLWQGSCASVETWLKTCLELPKSCYLIFLYSDLMDQFEGSRRFDDHQWKSSATHEISRVIIFKITLELYRSLCLHERGSRHFWSSDLFTQWLKTSDVLERSPSLRPPQFNDGARPWYYTIRVPSMSQIYLLDMYLSKSSATNTMWCKAHFFVKCSWLKFKIFLLHSLSYQG